MTHSLTPSDIMQFQSYLMDSNVKLNTAKKVCARRKKARTFFVGSNTDFVSEFFGRIFEVIAGSGICGA